ncbi:hypothetical protein M0R45_014771 [Rubus argutus]|uniref:Protein kinase domain-containing protein n=1 Tax=Rubus argutus TaxID=59490 RepID=A0AAW1XPQ6_RUBAR
MQQWSCCLGSAIDLNSRTVQKYMGSLIVMELMNLLRSRMDGKEQYRLGLAFGLTVGGFLTLVGVLALVWFIFCRKHKETGESSDDDTWVLNDSIPEDFEKGTGPRKFSYNELAHATGNFVQGEKLGEGGFGVYRGFIKDLNSYVAVKKISRGSKQGLKEYAAEVRIISRLRHRNLVQLIGWLPRKETSTRLRIHAQW